MSRRRELPDSYPVRVFVSKEEGWVTEQQGFADATRAVWDSVADSYSEFWPVSFRWIVLFDKFSTTSDEKVSAELRQLEKDLRGLVAESEADSKQGAVDAANQSANAGADDLDSLLDGFNPAVN